MKMEEEDSAVQVFPQILETQSQEQQQQSPEQQQQQQQQQLPEHLQPLQQLIEEMLPQVDMEEIKNDVEEIKADDDLDHGNEAVVDVDGDGDGDGEIEMNPSMNHISPIVIATTQALMNNCNNDNEDELNDDDDENNIGDGADISALMSTSLNHSGSSIENGDPAPNSCCSSFPQSPNSSPNMLGMALLNIKKEFITDPDQRSVCSDTNNGNSAATRHEKSLGLLTTRFVSLLQKAKNGILDLKMAADLLEVRQKRRIYDITNVLEGIKLIKKKSKNSIQWLGSGPGCNTKEVTQRLLVLKDELVELDTKELELDQHLSWARQSLVNIIDDQMCCNQKRYMYVDHEELCKIFGSNNNSIVIQAPPGASMRVETIMKSDLIHQEDMDEEGDSMENQMHVGDEIRHDDLTFNDPSQIEYCKSLKQIQMLRKRGRCNQIYLKSENGPANVMIVNQNFDDLDDMQEKDQNQLKKLAPYKRKKYAELKRLIEAQRLEAEANRPAQQFDQHSQQQVETQVLEQKILEETGLTLDEFNKPQESREPLLPPPSIIPNKTNQAQKSNAKNTNNNQNNNKSKSVTTKKRKEKTILPSRHLSPRRAAQHHLFCPSSRTSRDSSPYQPSTVTTRGKRERKDSSSSAVSSTSKTSDENVPAAATSADDSGDRESQSSTTTESSESASIKSDDSQQQQQQPQEPKSRIIKCELVKSRLSSVVDKPINVIFPSTPVYATKSVPKIAVNYVNNNNLNKKQINPIPTPPTLPPLEDIENKDNNKMETTPFEKSTIAKSECSTPMITEQTPTIEMAENSSPSISETTSSLDQQQSQSSTQEEQQLPPPVYRQPLSRVQIKLDIDDLIIPDIYLPFVRLSPPPSNQDYHFNLTNSEGISDLFLYD